MALRVSWQFHWRNEGYGSMADFLSRFNSKRRHMLRREMAAPAEQGSRSGPCEARSCAAIRQAGRRERTRCTGARWTS